jgi:Cysteine-rich secretory protein family
MRRDLFPASPSVAPALALAVLLVAAACGGARTTRRTVVTSTPSGTRTTTITTTTRTVSVPAPAPPARSADPLPADPLARYNLEQVNAYRRRNGREALLYDARISAFAQSGSRQLSRDHAAHAHFAANAEASRVFGSRSAENQGDPRGVHPMDNDTTTSGRHQIDIMLKIMFDEGPGGGHYENMMNPKYRRVGIGIYHPGGTLYMTNDFSD